MERWHPPPQVSHTAGLDNRSADQISQRETYICQGSETGRTFQAEGMVGWCSLAVRPDAITHQSVGGAQGSRALDDKQEDPGL